ncbi:vesicle transport protein SFT2B [Catenaria anguillulae PL171]|uniref:Protein transport protein SFT2 n=1 Tax=Catenaria anguillulae PL171 TaxID=765915 RepID=A0A1Y2I3K6_9FUNG|nr:vesicle transport protein SFT2B [Catenaria anguillulae PL171]
MPRNPFATMEAGGQNDSIMDDACGACNLTRKQRLIGFGCCFVAGFVISALSFLYFATSRITGFAIFYTFGNIVSLLSTSFLTGFKSQMKGMFDEKRKLASIVYLASMAATLTVALVLGSAPLCLVFCFIQFLALFWYSLSYIPFGRDIVKKAVGVRT